MENAVKSTFIGTILEIFLRYTRDFFTVEAKILEIFLRYTRDFFTVY